MSITGNIGGDIHNITNENTYTDLETRIEANESDIYDLQQSILDIDNTLTNHENRITLNETKLTDISYSTDVTTINNNVVISSGKTLTLDGLNVKSQIDTNTSNIETINNNIATINNTLTDISYATDVTTINNNLVISSGKTLTLDGLNVKSQIDTNTSNIATLQTITSGMSYEAGGVDLTTFNNNVTISSGKIFRIGTMNVEARISTNSTNISLINNTLIGVSYSNDTTEIDNNLTLTYGKNLTMYGDLVVNGVNISTAVSNIQNTKFLSSGYVRGNFDLNVGNINNYDWNVANCSLVKGNLVTTINVKNYVNSQGTNYNSSYDYIGLKFLTAGVHRVTFGWRHIRPDIWTYNTTNTIKVRLNQVCGNYDYSPLPASKVMSFVCYGNSNNANGYVSANPENLLFFDVTDNLWYMKYIIRENTQIVQSNYFNIIINLLVEPNDTIFLQFSSSNTYLKADSSRFTIEYLGD